MGLKSLVFVRGTFVTLLSERRASQTRVVCPPRYFFHIEGEKPHHDEVGKELADDGVAWTQAVRMLRHTENGMQPGDNWTLRVFNGEKPIYVIAVVSRRY